MGEGQRISREKCKANTPALSSGKLLHTCDTLPGNSGSPVIDAGLQQVVALHHAGSKADSVNFAILMSEILANSKVLTAYKAPISVQQVAPKTAEITACDALYSAAAEAKACYAYDVYIKSCATHTLAPMARGYVEEFCDMAVGAKVSNDNRYSSNLPTCADDTDYFDNCFGIKDDMDSGKYEGEFQKNKYHGKGTYIDSSGTKYTGEWQNGERFGFGEELKITKSKRGGIGIIYTNEESGVKVLSVLEGGPAIAAGIKVGDLITHVDNTSMNGLTVEASLNIISGNAGSEIAITLLKNGRGQPVLIKMQRDIFVELKTEYSGQWSNDKKNGDGIEKMSNWAVYRGQFKSGQYHGIGEYKFIGSSTRAGESFYGELKDGKFNGQGTYNWANGDKYVGEYKDGQYNGQGTYNRANGDKYVGEFKDDKFNGQGTYNRANGDKYVGEFKNNTAHGTGISIWKMGQTLFDTKYEDAPSDGLTPNSTVHTVFPYLKKQFMAFPTYKREQIQSNLKRKGLYTSSIDGKWGRGTLTALVEFALSDMGTVDLRSQADSKTLLAAVLR
jgi:hypothetical protein